MFIGEFACILVFKLILLSARCRNQPPPMELGKQNWNPLIFLIPALCDCTATSSMYVGLNLTYASSFQVIAVLALSLLSCNLAIYFILACTEKNLGLSNVSFSDVAR